MDHDFGNAIYNSIHYIYLGKTESMNDFAITGSHGGLARRVICKKGRTSCRFVFFQGQASENTRTRNTNSYTSEEERNNSKKSIFQKHFKI